MLAHMHKLAIKGRRGFPKLLKEIGAKRIAEIGVADGENIQTLCECDPDIIVAIDDWAQPSRSTEFVHRTGIVNGFHPVVKMALQNRAILPIRLESEIAVKIFDDGFFDFVYIDANHTYKYVKRDIGIWWDKVAENGMLAGHDYNLCELRGPQVSGVKRAVHEFASERGLLVTIVEEESPYSFDSWVLVKSEFNYMLDPWKRP